MPCRAVTQASTPPQTRTRTPHAAAAHHDALQHGTDAQALFQGPFAGEDVKCGGRGLCAAKPIYLWMLLCAVVTKHKPGERRGEGKGCVSVGRGVADEVAQGRRRSGGRTATGPRLRRRQAARVCSPLQPLLQHAASTWQAQQHDLHGHTATSSCEPPAIAGIRRTQRKPTSPSRATRRWQPRVPSALTARRISPGQSWCQRSWSRP